MTQCPAMRRFAFILKIFGIFKASKRYTLSEAMDTVLNKEEQKALWRFLTIYVGTAFVLMSMIAVLYYNEEITSMREKCTMEMKNIAMGIEKELMHAQMENLSYHFNPPQSAFKVAKSDEI